MAFCFRLSHALFELQTRKKKEKLTENAAESIHGRILLVGVFAFTNLMRWIRPSFQIPNLEKSGTIMSTKCKRRVGWVSSEAFSGRRDFPLRETSWTKSQSCDVCNTLIPSRCKEQKNSV